MALIALPLSAVSAQKLTGPASTVAPPDPVSLDTLGMFRARFVKVGDDVFIGGQPTEKALRELRAQGVVTVVNLRSPEEMTRSVNFDEAALVQSLGMKYVYLPMRGSPDFPYAPKAVQELTAAMKATDGKLLLHCTVAWRASHLWAAYLIQERHVPVATALAQTRAINLMDDMRISDKQPLEEFLGRAVPGLAHPPAR
ncbi:MAG: protein tyrosine phosphatase family protein [Gemmatimonadaceae bacterium]